MEWFDNRKIPVTLELTTSNDMTWINMNNYKRFSNGGHSVLFSPSEKDTRYLVRTITRDKRAENEIAINNILKHIIDKNVNPHFCYTYAIYDGKHMSIEKIQNNEKPRSIKSSKNAKIKEIVVPIPKHGMYYQHVIERLDGDISCGKFNRLRLNTDLFIIQMYAAIYTLAKHNIRVNDIKSQNILFKEFSKPISLTYRIKDMYYTLSTKTVYIISDYGASSKYQDTRHFKNMIDLKMLFA